MANTYTVGTGKTFTTLVAALAAVDHNDTLVCTAGETFIATGAEFGHNIPAKHGVTVRSSAVGFPFLPASPGTQINPITQAQFCFKIVGWHDAPGISLSTSGGGVGAHDWTFIGMEIESVGGTTYQTGSAINLGSFLDGVTETLACYNFTFTHCYTHPSELNPADLTTPDAVSLAIAMITNVGGVRTNGCYLAGGTAPFDNRTGVTDPNQGYGVLIGGGIGDFRDDNSHVQGFQNPFFMGGGDNFPHPDRTATVSASAINLTTDIGTATLTGSVEMPIVGDYVAFKVSLDLVQNSRHRIGVITAVVGHDVTYTMPNGNTGNGGSGWDSPGVAPLVGTSCFWRGYNITDTTWSKTHFVGCPYELRNVARDTKAWGEIKDADRLTFSGVIFEDWKGNNVGIYPQNQNGSQPWVMCRDILFENVIFYGSKGCVGFSFGSSYHVAIPSTISTARLSNCYSKTISGSGYSFFGSIAGGGRIDIDHFFESDTTKSIINCVAPGCGMLTFTNSIVPHGAYGFNCDTGGTGSASCYGTSDSRLDITKTVLIDTTGIAGYFPSFYQNLDPDLVVGSIDDVGFVDKNAQNFQLAADSDFKGICEDGSDPGPNWADIYAAVNQDVFYRLFGYVPAGAAVPVTYGSLLFSASGQLLFINGQLLTVTS